MNAKFKQMDKFRHEYDELPDGAFFQLAEDMYGWTVDDWVWFANLDNKQKERIERGAVAGK